MRRASWGSVAALGGVAVASLLAIAVWAQEERPAPPVREGRDRDERRDGDRKPGKAGRPREERPRDEGPRDAKGRDERPRDDRPRDERPRDDDRRDRKDPRDRRPAPRAERQPKDVLVKLSEYWLGVGVMPVPEPLRAQLELPAAEGVVVGNLVPDSPAAKAGLKQFDVLLKAGDKTLSDARDLVGLIDKNKDKELAIELVRGGKKTTVNVKPEKRPEGQMDQPGFDHQVELLLGEVAPGRQPIRMRFFHPGMVLPPGAPVAPPLPDDVTIRISKQGGKPADIEVKQGEEHWSVGEEQLDKLPEKIRPHVESLLGRGTFNQSTRFFVEGPGGEGEFNIRGGRGPDGQFEEHLERQLSEMGRMVNQLREQVQQMRERRGGEGPRDIDLREGGRRGPGERRPGPGAAERGDRRPREDRERPEPRPRNPDRGEDPDDDGPGDR